MIRRERLTLRGGTDVVTRTVTEQVCAGSDTRIMLGLGSGTVAAVGLPVGAPSPAIGACHCGPGASLVGPGAAVTVARPRRRLGPAWSAAPAVASLALPFVFITVAAVLKGYDWRLDQAAATLGATRARILWEITVPLLRPGLLAAFLFAFITSFDDLTVALFVSGGIVVTLPKQMWDDMILQLNPTLAAVSTVVLVLVTALLAAAEALRRRAEARQAGARAGNAQEA